MKGGRGEEQKERTIETRDARERKNEIEIETEVEKGREKE